MINLKFESIQNIGCSSWTSAFTLNSYINRLKSDNTVFKIELAHPGQEIQPFEKGPISLNTLIIQCLFSIDFELRVSHSKRN